MKIFVKDFFKKLYFLSSETTSYITMIELMKNWKQNIYQKNAEGDIKVICEKKSYSKVKLIGGK